MTSFSPVVSSPTSSKPCSARVNPVDRGCVIWPSLSCGTAGGIKFAEDLLDDTFFALNGDVLTDLDLTWLWADHKRTGARASLGLYPVDDTSAFGLVDHDEYGEVLAFREKVPDRTEPGLINAGTYVLEKSVLDMVPAGQDVSIETEVFPKLVGDGFAPS